MSDAIAALSARLASLLPDADARLGVAVSGGSDSTALLLAAVDWRAAAPGRAVEAATVDHRLRPESGAEAEAAAALAARLGVLHETLPWEDAPGRGNLAAAAREARRARLADWAGRRGLAAVALGHTLDDRAETLLLRLARGSGLDGLAALREVSRHSGLVWLRPALGLRREALREALRARGVPWIEDPSNDDETRDRIGVRRALPALGLDPEGLAATAERLAADADHLAAEARALAPRVLALGPAGEILIDRAALAAAPAPLARRLLARLLRRLSGAAHPPRAAALAPLLALAAGRTPAPPRTLAGCVLDASDPALARLHREEAALPPPVAAAPGGVWDGRWRLPDPLPAAFRGAALGPLGPLPDPPARFRAAPPAARRVAPALFRNGALLAAPHAGIGPPDALEDRLARRLGIAPS